MTEEQVLQIETRALGIVREVYDSTDPAKYTNEFIYHARYLAAKKQSDHLRKELEFKNALLHNQRELKDAELCHANELLGQYRIKCSRLEDSEKINEGKVKRFTNANLFKRLIMAIRGRI